MPTPDDLARELAELRREVHGLRGLVEGLVEGRRPVSREGRVRTFVEGFDEALGGGVPTGHVVTLTGPSGSMKTSLALNMVYQNIQQGRRGLYISLEEGRESLLRTMSQLGMSPGEDFIVDIARLRMEHEAVEGASDWLQILKDYLARRTEKGDLGVLVIDPLNSLYSLADLRHPRRDLFHFFTFLRGLGVTTLLIAETDGAGALSNQEDFLADGVITLSFVTSPEAHVNLRIQCLKMRHANHSRDAFRLEFEGGRFRARRGTGSTQ